MGPDKGFINVKQDGGLMILSRYPMLTVSAFCFTYCGGWGFHGRADCWSNKGVIYARIQIGDSKDEYIHVFNTHLQAHNTQADKDIRKHQLGELRDFIRYATEFDYDTRPIIVLGDFNIIAKENEYSVLLNNLQVPQDPIDETLYGTKWFVDAWTTMRPREQPDYTWVGKFHSPGDGENCPYGNWGNPLANEHDKAQRIDYIFYYKGTAKVSLKPKSTSLVPSETPQTPYCFDDKTWIEDLKIKIRIRGDLKDELQSLREDRGYYVCAMSHEDQLRAELKRVYDLCGDARIMKTESFTYPTWLTYPRWLIYGCCEGETLILREASDNRWEWDGQVSVFIRKSSSCECVRISGGDDCTLKSNTVSDHLGVEMIFLK